MTTTLPCEKEQRAVNIVAVVVVVAVVEGEVEVVEQEAVEAAAWIRQRVSTLQTASRAT